jgi:acyl carrier protein
MQTTAIEGRIQRFIEEAFLFGQAGVLENGDSFLDHGIIDSTGILELIAFLQETFAIQVEEEEAIPENLDSVDRVAAYLRRKLQVAEASVPPVGEGVTI